MRTGRPTKLTRKIILPTAKQGETRTVTVAQAICERIEATGCSVSRAAKAVDVAAPTVSGWLKEAWMLVGKLERTPDLPLYVREQQLIDFLWDTQAAFARWVLMQETLLEQMSRGGVVIEEVVERVNAATGAVLERTTKTKTTLPDTATIRWSLERKARDEGFAPPTVTVAGPDGGRIPIDLGASDDEKAEALLAEITAYEQGLADAQSRAHEKAGTNGSG